MRGLSLLALGVGFTWAACSTPTYIRPPDAGVGDASNGADRKDMASLETSGDSADRPSDALDALADKTTDLAGDMLATDMAPRPDGGMDAPLDAPADVPVDMASDTNGTDVRLDTSVDLVAEKPVDAPLPAATISIDFAGASDPLARTEMAGVVPAINWNSAAISASSPTGSSGSLTGLVRSDGSNSGAMLGWMGSTSDVFPAIPATSPDLKMMRTFVRFCYMGSTPPDAGPLAMTVTLSSLPEPFVSRGFDLYVYTAQDVPADDMRTWSIAAGSAAAINIGAAPTDEDFNGAYKQVASGKGHYVRFNNLTGSSVTIKATPLTANRYACAAINGLQLVSH